ncbi:MAG: hypothetical protein ABW321_23460 [Polyangiales bacterium]
MVRRAVAELLLLAILPIALLLILYFHWGAGPLRLAACTVLFVYLALATRRFGYLPSVWEAGRWRGVLAALSVGLLALHGRSFWRDIAAGGECLTDMGRPSICAGEWLRRGFNPWAECAPKLTAAERRMLPNDDTWAQCVKVDRCIDRKAGGTYSRWTHHGPGFDFMDGYKYGPIAALVYTPFVHTLRERGVYGVNLAWWLLEVVALLLLARAAFPQQRATPWRTLCVWLSPRIVPMSWLPTWHIDAFWDSFDLRIPERDTFVLELTRRCSNDIIPVVLGLFALYLAARKRPALAGVLLGLSLAAKPLPALLWCLLLPGLSGLQVRRLVGATIITAFICYWPFFLWGPKEMIANLVLFSALRPTNSSSIRGYLPEGGDLLVSVLQLASCAWLVFAFYRGPRTAAGQRGERDLAWLLRSAALLTLVFVALNKVVHGNYLLWILPLAALAVAGVPFDDRRIVDRAGRG